MRIFRVGWIFNPSRPVSHALDLGANPTDSELWSYAKERHLVIVTKDADFSARILVSTAPPWIVHLRFGNMRRNEFHRFLAAVWPKVESLLPANKLVCGSAALRIQLRPSDEKFEALPGFAAKV